MYSPRRGEMLATIVPNAATYSRARIDLTRHKISDREPGEPCHAARAWMADTQNIERRVARGSLDRLVRPFSVLTEWNHLRDRKSNSQLHCES
jgi:hypothetical protein